MKYTIPQKFLLESDAKTRRLERSYISGDESVIIQLAKEYFRSENPKINTLIGHLNRLNTNESNEILSRWRNRTGFLSSSEFYRNMRETKPSLTEFESAAIKAGFKFDSMATDYDDGYYDVILYTSNYDDGFIWKVFSNKSGDITWNFGFISKQELEEAIKDYGGESVWKSWGMADYFKKYI